MDLITEYTHIHTQYQYQNTTNRSEIELEIDISIIHLRNCNNLFRNEKSDNKTLVTSVDDAIKLTNLLSCYSFNCINAFN